MNGYEVQRMAIYNNAALANIFLPSATIGQLIPGAFADIIFVDYQPNTPLTAGNLPWHIIFGVQQHMITMAIVAGKVLGKIQQGSSKGFIDFPFARLELNIKASKGARGE